MKEQQFNKITTWQKETFVHDTPLTKLNHLAEELRELQADLETNSKGKRHEFADAFILLFGAAASDGMTYQDICTAIDEKMAINYFRKWGVPKENGVVNHIEE